MSAMHLRQPAFTYGACGRSTKKKLGIQKLKETGDSRTIYESELGKACFRLDMVYRDFKDLTIEQILIKYYVIKHLILLQI